MSDLLEYLSAYVREQAPRFLSDPEYAQNRAYRDWHFSWLQDHLDPEALRPRATGGFRGASFSSRPAGRRNPSSPPPCPWGPGWGP